MKILFVENRHKTYFFDAIAKCLQQNGHKIYWIVQNHQFIPQNGIVFKIPYPKNKDLKSINKGESAELKEIIISDRQLNHFGFNSDDHFYYYDHQISNLLKEIKPDLAFGESTAFHELIIIRNCKSLGLLYLNPSTCRYPTNRFSFYKYDTLEPFKGSGEVLDNDVAVSIIEKIVNRTTQPNYMVKVNNPVKEKWLDKLKLIQGYYLGDKYNTPSPFTKYKTEANKERFIKRWDVFAEGQIKNSNQFKILYPLQLQPEANLDVWGRPFRNQLEVVKNIFKNTDENCVIYVKPNPKSKYEISEELISFIEKEERLIPLKHDVKMDNVFTHMDLVITVTGTIAIECILANKPVVTLIKTINNQSANCLFLDSFSKLNPTIDLIKKEKFPKLTKDQKINFLEILNKTSYSGIVSDPLSDRNSVSKENIGEMVMAFNSILELKDVS